MPAAAPRCGASPAARGELKVIRAGVLLALVLTAIAGCAAGAPYSVAVAEERMVRHCTYISTISENADMGAFQIHPKFTYDGRDMVLRRAEMLNATHVVFLADYPSGSAATAYHCPE
jgi:hypothetical protein